MDERVERHGPWVALVLLTAAIYCRLSRFGVMVGWDDELYLLSRPEVVDWFSATWYQRLATPELGYPVPLPTFVHYLLRQLPAGWVAGASHLANLGVHVVVVLVAYRLSRRWLGDRGAACAASALWAAHPLLVESVAWLANLKGLMFAGFAVGSALVWERHLDAPGWGTGAGALGLFVAALGCRPDAVVLGPLWAGQTLLRRPARLRQRVVWAPVAAAGLISAVYLPPAVAGQWALVERENPGSLLGMGPIDRARRAFAALTLQIEHLFYPFGLHPDYPADGPGADLRAWIGVGLFSVAAAATVLQHRFASDGDRGWLVFWVFYAPVSGVVVLPRFTADAYMYLPLFGLSCAAVAAGLRVFERLSVRSGLVRALVAASVVALAVASHVQTLRWRNIVTLWGPVAEVQPSNIKAKWMVASGYVRAEEDERALEIYREAYPAFVAAGRIPLRMAVALERTGRPQRAVEVAAKMMAYEGEQSDRVERFLVRTAVEHRVEVAPGSRSAEALADAVETVLERQGGFDEGVCRRGVRYAEAQDLARVAEQFRRCE